ncbi:hypothetical protein D3C78_20320 [compost metagenome]
MEEIFKELDQMVPNVDLRKYVAILPIKEISSGKLAVKINTEVFTNEQIVNAGSPKVIALRIINAFDILNRSILQHSNNPDVSIFTQICKEHNTWHDRDKKLAVIKYESADTRIAPMFYTLDYSGSQAGWRPEHGAMPKKYQIIIGTEKEREKKTRAKTDKINITYKPMYGHTTVTVLEDGSVSVPEDRVSPDFNQANITEILEHTGTKLVIRVHAYSNGTGFNKTHTFNLRKNVVRKAPTVPVNLVSPITNLKNFEKNPFNTNWHDKPLLPESYKSDKVLITASGDLYVGKTLFPIYLKPHWQEMGLSKEALDEYLMWENISKV